MEIKAAASQQKDALEISIEPVFDDGDFFYRVAAFDVEYHAGSVSKTVKDISHYNTLQLAIDSVMDWYGEKNIAGQE